MKLYVLTEQGSKTPERDWDNTVIFYSSKKQAKQNFDNHRQQIREADIKIGKIVK